jgi:hypothetical protein
MSIVDEIARKEVPDGSKTGSRRRHRIGAIVGEALDWAALQAEEVSRELRESAERASSLSYDIKARELRGKAAVAEEIAAKIRQV